MGLSAEASAFVPRKAVGEAAASSPLPAEQNSSAPAKASPASEAATRTAIEDTGTKAARRALDFRSALGVYKSCQVNGTGPAQPSKVSEAPAASPVAPPTPQRKQSCIGPCPSLDERSSPSNNDRAAAWPELEASPARDTTLSTPPKFSWKSMLQSGSDSSSPQPKDTVRRQNGFVIEQEVAQSIREAAAGVSPVEAIPQGSTTAGASLLNPFASSVSQRKEGPCEAKAHAAPSQQEALASAEERKEHEKAAAEPEGKEAVDLARPLQEPIPASQPKVPQNAKQRKMMKQKMKKLEARAAAERAAVAATETPSGTETTDAGVYPTPKGGMALGFERLASGGSESSGIEGNSAAATMVGPSAMPAIGVPQPSFTGASLDRMYSDLSWEECSGKIRPEHFECLTVVGQGAFGKVFQVQHKRTKEILAMKVMRKEKILQRDHFDYTKAERDILTTVKHPYIVELKYSFQTPYKLYLLLEFINGGHLFFQLFNQGLFSERLTKFYLSEIISAVGHLHSIDIVHRDLKPENILLSADGHIKVTDFGLAKSIEHGKRTNSLVGTMEYMAPEIVAGTGHSKPADWWSVGILTHEMLTGGKPFRAANKKALEKKIMNDKLKLPTFLTSEAHGLLKGLLEKNPEKRLATNPSDPQKDIRKVKFFAGLNWGKVESKEIPPPFVPSVVDGQRDVSNFDTFWTELPAHDSPVNTPDGSLVTGDPFLGYSYTHENHLASLAKARELEASLARAAESGALSEADED
mmetsp:Transcript_8531/g.31523  ORF Transcript_8531/g.31523 Transcript_8531/m.31523 type:complete len:752 (-) Transcript_8531:4954-7209(-)